MGFLYITLHNSKQPICKRVLLVLFGSRGQIPLLRDQMTVKKATTGACQYSIDPFRQEIEISMNHNFPLIPNSPLITME